MYSGYRFGPRPRYGAKATKILYRWGSKVRSGNYRCCGELNGVVQEASPWNGKEAKWSKSRNSYQNASYGKENEA